MYRNNRPGILLGRKGDRLARSQAKAFDEEPEQLPEPTQKYSTDDVLVHDGRVVNIRPTSIFRGETGIATTAS